MVPLRSPMQKRRLGQSTAYLPKKWDLAGNCRELTVIDCHDGRIVSFRQIRQDTDQSQLM